jgi:hypothetical protein
MNLEPLFVDPPVRRPSDLRTIVMILRMVSPPWGPLPRIVEKPTA